jgi:hypothetical protein
MALVLGEGQLAAPAELLLGARRLAIDCQITVEWLRGIEEPTWYGYFLPQDELRMLPGTYRVAIAGAEYRILLRRLGRTGIPNAVPFWGLGDPPAVERAGNEATADSNPPSPPMPAALQQPQASGR